MRNALLIVVAGVVATIAVGTLLGAFRPSPPTSSTVDGSPPAAASPTTAPASSSPSAAPSSASPEASPSIAPSEEPSPDPILIGAGDIATCDHNFDEQTARLVARNEGIVFTLGDNAYAKGTPDEYRDCYDPSWGRVKDRTQFPVPGNHEYQTGNAAGYRGYFGKRATPDGDTWYSRDVGEWHVIVLDANCTEITGGCGPGSPQLRWLRRDLAASDARCTLAMWHQPRFSSGEEHGNDPDVAPFWDVLYDAGADLVLNGHDHNYERFAPQDPDANLDEERGITEVVVGTGGGEMRGMGTTKANSIVRRGRLLGVFQVTLHPDGWSYRFISTDNSFSDSGTAACH